MSFQIIDPRVKRNIRPYLFVPKLNKTLPAKKVACYLQIENKIRAIINFDIAAQVRNSKQKGNQNPKLETVKQIGT